jgi:hypothetical protein
MDERLGGSHMRGRFNYRGRSLRDRVKGSVDSEKSGLWLRESEFAGGVNSMI